MKSLKGHFLIASRHLTDENFARTVVLMLEHGPDGAVGLVLNRPTNKTVQEIWKLVENTPCRTQTVLSLGGPLQGPLMCLHRNSQHSDAEVLGGVYLSTQKEQIRKLVKEEGATHKFFAGYAGWGAGQLESELEMGGWLVLPATAEMIFGVPVDQLWTAALQLTGKNFYRTTLGLHKFPEDATLN